MDPTPLLAALQNAEYRCKSLIHHCTQPPNHEAYGEALEACLQCLRIAQNARRIAEQVVACWPDVD